MVNKKDIKKILVEMKADEKTILFILLSSDGSINRIGDGSLKNEDSDMYIGMIKDKLFEKLIEKISKDAFQHAGVYKSNDIKGSQCELLILLSTDKKEIGFKFNYGSESFGPPKDICEIVRIAVNLTEDWWQAQRKMINKK